MTTPFAYFVTALVMSLVLTPICRHIARGSD